MRSKSKKNFWCEYNHKPQENEIHAVTIKIPISTTVAVLNIGAKKGENDCL